MIIFFSRKICRWYLLFSLFIHFFYRYKIWSIYTSRNLYYNNLNKNKKVYHFIFINWKHFFLFFANFFVCIRFCLLQQCIFVSFLFLLLFDCCILLFLFLCQTLATTEKKKQTTTFIGCLAATKTTTKEETNSRDYFLCLLCS